MKQKILTESKEISDIQSELVSLDNQSLNKLIHNLLEQSIQSTEEAKDATTVKSKWPKIFNRLLRKQNVVNRRLITGLKDAIKAIANLNASHQSKLKDHQSRIHFLEKQNQSLFTVLTSLQQELIRNRNFNISKQNIQGLSSKDPSADNLEMQSLMDAFYLSFENKFRGSPDLIRKRQMVYLPYINESFKDITDPVLLDVGCGRGEWLELLQNNNIVGIGIDTNPDMVAECKNRQQDVILGDAIDFMKDKGENSLGAITGFHIIEHIPFTQLVKLFNHCLVALKEGGIMIFETPNPENLCVGSCNFYLDYTHILPYPPQLIKFLADYVGFSRTKILELHPVDKSFQLEVKDRPTDRLNKLINGPQDYAIIAYK
tara:strand:+ start:1414 stop:2532 length:1119 start_codon:yes stop_codon:yes gene_type:complete